MFHIFFIVIERYTGIPYTPFSDTFISFADLTIARLCSQKHNDCITHAKICPWRRQAGWGFRALGTLLQALNELTWSVLLDVQKRSKNHHWLWMVHLNWMNRQLADKASALCLSPTSAIQVINQPKTNVTMPWYSGAIMCNCTPGAIIRRSAGQPSPVW